MRGIWRSRASQERGGGERPAGPGKRAGLGPVVCPELCLYPSGICRASGQPLVTWSHSDLPAGLLFPRRDWVLVCLFLASQQRAWVSHWGQYGSEQSLNDEQNPQTEQVQQKRA